MKWFEKSRMQQHMSKKYTQHRFFLEQCGKLGALQDVSSEIDWSPTIIDWGGRFNGPARLLVFVHLFFSADRNTCRPFDASCLLQSPSISNVTHHLAVAKCSWLHSWWFVVEIDNHLDLFMHISHRNYSIFFLQCLLDILNRIVGCCIL